MPPQGSLPPHMEQFHDLVARTLMSNPNRRFNKSFSNIFGGTIVKNGADKLRRGHIAYRDPHGHKAPITSAGSGLLASAPLLAGLHYTAPGGALTIEEPEAHVEPSTQLALIGEIVSVALSKNIRLVMTTHSDYVVKKILALVSSRKIRPADTGLYQFQRQGQSHTRINRIPVDRTGAAEQESFHDALDSLVEEFSI